MIKSMTSFADSEMIEFPYKVRIEGRSYNSRYLDIALKISRDYQSIEEKIKQLIAGKISRGRVELTILVEDDNEISCKYEINMPKAAGLYEALNLLNNTFDLGGIDVNTLIGVGDIIRAKKVTRSFDKIWILISKCLNSVMLKMDEMKITEGDNLVRDFETRLNYIENSIKWVEAKASDLLPFYRDKLKNHIKKLTDGLVEFDNERMLHEASILAIKSDISEEIVRAYSHIEQFRVIMKDKGPSGKKLNFLLQEFSREFNTMGSKFGNPEVSHMIVSVKFELEKIREQIQNIE